VAEGSPRKKALPLAPPDSDEEDLPELPQAAKPNALLEVRDLFFISFFFFFYFFSSGAQARPAARLGAAGAESGRH
jgi:hypothetical protein